MLLNDSRHAGSTCHASHDAIAHIVATLASSHGVSTTACLRMVPLAEPDTMERGDIVASVRGLLRPRPHAPIPTRLVLDFALRHTYTSSHVLKRDTLKAIEQVNN